MARIAEEEKVAVQQQTRCRLLAAAEPEFATNGFAGANINRISTRAGYAKGTIYNYFASKQALLLALIEEIAGRHTCFIADRVGKGAGPEERLARFFDAGLAYVRQQPQAAQIAISAVFGHDDAVREHVFQAYMPLFALIGSDILGPGVASGAFREVDADQTTGLLMSLYLGSCSMAMSSGAAGFDAEQMADFVLGGLRRHNCRVGGEA